jgi:ppGpp synthetase/RelA/SpoT-type nucleotidyltranferase
MKIPASIRRLYDDQSESCHNLRARVDALLKSRLHARWHYESRVKSIEAFTLKIESGRFPDPSALEDFFAATIVVRNSAEITEAEAIASGLFSVDKRRPKQDAETHKAPEQFPFDDLRLYARWRDDPALPVTGLEGVLFELQIKTFLQHAWSIATHDLVYKSDDASWSKARIAYQIKAMLENAEVSIQEAARLSESAALAKSDAKTASLRKFIALITDLWTKEDLPSDIRRLAENVMQLAQLVEMTPDDLKALLQEDKDHGSGPLTRNLTPYGVVLQTLLTHRKKNVNAALMKKPRIRVLIPKELEIPKDIDTIRWEPGAAVFVK